jgi:ACS family hexuronate transporter-like MFS transporter
MNGLSRLRWLAVSFFALTSALNFLDRQLLAALAPELMREFSLSDMQYGFVVSVFSVPYTLVAPLAGLFIDRVGLTRGSSISVSLWSLAGMATGFTRGLPGLGACRAALGFAEAGGIPGSAKASAEYLPPRERAIGSAISQVGLTVGSVSAPILAGFVALRYGWRAAFFVTGALGFVWIPLWWLIARRVPRYQEERVGATLSAPEILRQRRYWGLLASNILLMSVYTLWVNWTTVFLVRAHHMSQHDANLQFAWIPPLFATAGGLTGGWLALRWSKSSGDIAAARDRCIAVGVALTLSTIAVPWIPSTSLAIAAVCLSFFGCVVASVNIYSLPLDWYGASRAAFAVSGLTSAYGLLQSFYSPLIGGLVDRYGFAPACLLSGLLPLLSYLVLRTTSRQQ